MLSGLFFVFSLVGRRAVLHLSSSQPLDFWVRHFTYGLFLFSSTLFMFSLLSLKFSIMSYSLYSVFLLLFQPLCCLTLMMQHTERSHKPVHQSGLLIKRQSRERAAKVLFEQFYLFTDLEIDRKTFQHAWIIELSPWPGLMIWLFIKVSS